MAELNRQQPDAPPEDAALVPYSAAGHPSIEQLMADQGTSAIADVSALHGDFWPEEEPIEDFLAALHEWRGHRRTDPAT